MFCRQCGNAIEDGSAFCPKCGHRIEGSDSDDKRQYVTEAIGDAVEKAANKLYGTTGGTGQVELKFKDLFSAVFKKHEKRESEEIFICGTATTTPNIKDVRAEWPKPWIWSRVLALFLLVVALLFALYAGWQKPMAYPGLIFMSAFAAPFSMLIFFFETNAFRNISLVETVAIFFIGGVACLIMLNFLPQVALNGTQTAERVLYCVGSGAVGEAAKVILIVIVFRLRKSYGSYYILNGMLIGAAIGAGVAVFESAGTIMAYGKSLDALSYAMIVLGVLSVGGHVAWGAAEGAALALGDKESRVDVGQVVDPVSLSVFTLKNPAFLAIFVSCIALHIVWSINFSWFAPGLEFLETYFIKYAILVVVIWIIILVMLNRGIEQVNEVTGTASAKKAPGAVSQVPSIDSEATPPEMADDSKLAN